MSIFFKATRFLQLTCMAALMGSLVNLPASAASRPDALQSTGDTLEQTLIASRLRLRLGVRSSRYRLSGFRRGAECMVGNLVALAPPARLDEISEDLIDGVRDSIENEVSAIDKTVSARPTFFVYVPQIDNPAKAQFTLQDGEGTQELYTVTFDLDGKEGIIGVTLPDDAEALVVNQPYVWQMGVDCSSEANAMDEFTPDVVVDSSIERVALDDMPTSSSLDTAIYYAEQGIWQDAIATLAQLRYANSNDVNVTEAWQDLLALAGLPEVADAPIVEIYKEAP